MNPSFARKTGLPARRSTGPPPIASVTALQSTLNVSRAVTAVPTAPSAVSFDALEPRATSTAPPGGMGVLPPVLIWTTVPVRSMFGRATGKEDRTASVVSPKGGVVGAHDGV